MGIIVGIFKILLVIVLVTALIFSFYLLGKDVIYVREVINETKANNGTCDFDWKTFHLACEYKTNTCIINGTQEFGCERSPS